MSKVKLFNLALISALIFSLIISMVGFTDSCEEMHENIIRIRILANSDSDSDQSLKIKIRDAVLNTSKELYSGTDSYDLAVNATKENLDVFLTTAQNTVFENGFDYKVSVDFRKEFFETRVYDEFTLPAGYYETAVFTVGEGRGRNWWCVIFPRVCVGACSERLETTLSDDAANVAYGGKKYTVKFKTVEIFEKIKKFFDF